MGEKEYSIELGKKRASRLNVIIDAVNRKKPKGEMKMDEVESIFYDRLVDEAKRHEKDYGVWPVFEMCEIEWDDPVLNIYGDDDSGR